MGSIEDDVKVYIGSEQAEINTLVESDLTITVPSKDPGQECINGTITDHPCVVVSFFQKKS